MGRLAEKRLRSCSVTPDEITGAAVQAHVFRNGCGSHACLGRAVVWLKIKHVRSSSYIAAPVGRRSPLLLEYVPLAFML